MIRTILFNPATQEIEHGGLELVDTWERSPDLLIWLDLEFETTETEEKILTRFDLHPFAIQDALRKRHPPKIEKFENHLFVLLRGLDADTSDIDFGVIQLALFTGDRFLITKHAKRSTSTNWLFERVQENPALLSEGPDALILRLANRLVRRYVEILLAFEPRLEEIETEIFDRPEDALLSELTRHKSRLREIRRIASYHLEIANQIENDTSLMGPDFVHETTDFREQIQRTISLSELYYETARDLTDGYVALSTHRLNRVMQVLTVITVIFVPLTFIAGIYGMNFENMPELRTSTGYFVVLGTMASIGAGLLLLFKRKGWV